jgi:predicted phage baseplate assembly protein
VDDAKRFVQSRCPEWTDHNVSDPGVTLIEAMAQMVDQLLYRLNRVPDRLYVKFLELIGVTLVPPAAATCDVTLWLSAPRVQPVVVPAGTEVATRRTDRRDRAVVFTTTEQLEIRPTRLARVLAVAADGAGVRELTGLLGASGGACFGSRPRPGEAMLVGLEHPVPGLALLLKVACRIEGIGVSPELPPVAWEAFDGTSWLPCELERDTTGGLNRAGEVVLHVPKGHRLAVLEATSAAWVRCRVTEPIDGQPFYSSSPVIEGMSAATLGGTVGAVHAEVVRDEVVGVSEGVPAQRFRVRKPPIVAGGTQHAIEVAGPEGWERWEQRGGFHDCGPDDRAFTLDPTTGEIAFGPAVRLEDGTVRQYGAVPPKGAAIRVPEYRSGGGAAGNVAKGALSVLLTTVPYIGRVENRHPATGGADGEDLENAKLRGPIRLRSVERAVVASDYVHLARQEAPEAARVHCVVLDEDHVVRLLVVPAVQTDEFGRVEFEALVPPEGMLRRIAAVLERRRTVGARVVIEPPLYFGATVVARLRARRGADRAAVAGAAERALYLRLHPVLGGRDGSGWPFGVPVQREELFAVLHDLPGVESVEELLLFPADVVTGARGQAVERLELEDNCLPFSYGHQVRVDPAP